MNQTRLNALQAEWQQGASQETSRPSRLQLAKVVLVPDVFQCRPGANQRTGITKDGKPHLAGLATELRSSVKADLDAVTIIKVGSRNVLVDGHHRFAAYKSAKRTDLPVKFFSGSPTQALLAVGKENRKLKLTMSAADRSQWAWELVKTQKFSKSEVRLASGVSDGTIGTMRRVLAEHTEAKQPLPELWTEARPKKVTDEESASALSREWAAALNATLGPAKNFKSLGKKIMLRDALVIWAPRLAEELALLLADDFDIRAQIDEVVRANVEEMGEEAFEAMVFTRAQEMLIQQGKLPAPPF